MKLKNSQRAVNQHSYLSSFLRLEEIAALFCAVYIPKFNAPSNEPS